MSDLCSKMSPQWIDRFIGGVYPISGLTIGTSYDLTFAMAGKTDCTPTVKTLKASLGGQSAKFTFDTTGHSTSSLGWMMASVMFTATANSELLSFQDLSH